MACIVLPLLPVGPYGPLDAIRPRELWAFVLFFSGLSFVGWLTGRAIGPRQGLIVWAILGGLVSSTSVTTALAHQSRSKPARLTLGAGAVAACTVMLVRVAGLFQLVLFVILWVQSRWSADAIVATSVFVGLTDVDALTLSLARGATGTALEATGAALAAGVLANTALKLAVAVVIGRGAFRAVTAGALGAMMALMAAALWLTVD